MEKGGAHRKITVCVESVFSFFGNWNFDPNVGGFLNFVEDVCIRRNRAERSRKLVAEHRILVVRVKQEQVAREAAESVRQLVPDLLHRVGRDHGLLKVYRIGRGGLVDRVLVSGRVVALNFELNFSGQQIDFVHVISLIAARVQCAVPELYLRARRLSINSGTDRLAQVR